MKVQIIYYYSKYGIRSKNDCVRTTFKKLLYFFLTQLNLPIAIKSIGILYIMYRYLLFMFILSLCKYTLFCQHKHFFFYTKLNLYKCIILNTQICNFLPIVILFSIIIGIYEYMYSFFCNKIKHNL